MRLPIEIQNALDQYDSSIAAESATQMAEHLAIIKLKKLSDEDSRDPERIIQCFADAVPAKSHKAYEVFSVCLKWYVSGCDSSVGQSLILLEEADIFNQQNLTTIKAHPYPIAICLSLKTLAGDELLTQEHFSALCRHSNPCDFAYALTDLKDNTLLTQEFIDAISSHRNPGMIVDAVLELQKANILTLDTKRVVLAHEDPKEVAKAFLRLSAKNLLISDNIEAVKNHEEPESLAYALVQVDEVGLSEVSKNKIRKAAIAHQDPCAVFSSLILLDKKSLLTDENIRAVVKHQKLPDLLDALNDLHDINLLSQEGIDLVKSNENNLYAPFAFKQLNRANLLTEENKDAILRQDNIKDIGLLLDILNDSGLVTQANFSDIIANPSVDDYLLLFQVIQKAQCLSQNIFDLLMACENLEEIWLVSVRLISPQLITEANLIVLFANPRLFAEQAIAHVWSRIPDQILTQAVFDRIVECAQQQNPEQALSEYVDNILARLQPAPGLARPINDRQSTHVTSVHKAVSDSASRLKDRYGALVSKPEELSEIISDIKRFIGGLKVNESSIQAAIRCLERMTSENYVFDDPGSEVSIQQLLAFSFLSIHDSSIRQGNFEDACNQFVQGLVEIQREYNLSEAGIDQGGTDSPACCAGAFNKLIEKLESIDPACEIRYLTKKTATLKLLCVVREEAIKYLGRLANPTSVSELHAFTQLIGDIKESDLEVIWHQIKDEVTTRMFDEFGSLYKGKDDPLFIADIDAGQYGQLSDLNMFQKTIQNSRGYQLYCSNLLYSSGLFASTREADEKSAQAMLSIKLI